MADRTLFNWVSYQQNQRDHKSQLDDERKPQGAT